MPENTERAVVSTGPRWAAVPTDLLIDSELSTGARLTFAILQSYAWQPDNCFPGQERVAAQVGVTDRCLRNYLTELADAGVIDIVRRGDRKTNRYVLHPETRYSDRNVASDSDRNVVSGRDRNAGSYKEQKDEEHEKASSNGKPLSRVELRGDQQEMELGDDPRLAETVVVLVEAARTRKVARPTSAAIAKVIKDFPGRDYVALARECAFWLIDGKGARRENPSVIQTYRTFCRTTDPAKDAGGLGQYARHGDPEQGVRWAT